MSIRVAIHHRTEYLFDRQVTLLPHTIRLRPAPHTRTPVHQYSLKIEPESHFLNWTQDPFGNFMARLVFPEKTRKLVVDVGLVVELVSINPFDFFLEEYAENFPFEYPKQLRKELKPFFHLKEKGPRLKKWLKTVPRESMRTVDFLVVIIGRLEKEIGYNVRMEPGVQTPEETLKIGRGSCRDTAWLLVHILRHLGLAARFVSGYLVQLVADVDSLDGPSGPKKDFTDLHAWAEVYVPGAGWIGLDPTSGLFASEGHIPLVCTPDPVSAAPIEGAMDECEVEFSFVNEVTRIREDPRVTKPFSDEQWQQMMLLGEKVEQKLEAGDVRLTMGGEPTFVSIDDMDGDEWNIAALGENKRKLAETLFRRMWGKFAPGGVLQHGQGKWYPGEPLPRWALHCYWRKDGKPIWQDSTLMANPTTSGESTRDDACQFGKKLAERLHIPVKHLIPGYEDSLYYLWKEGNLPKNVSIKNNRLDDPMERKRIRRLFEVGLDKVVGYVLPVAWDSERERWVSSHWKFRGKQMFLVPGDSPMGLRLPLGSLLWEEPKKRQQVQEKDPFAPHESLPDEILAKDASEYTSPGPVSSRYSEIIPSDPTHQLQEQQTPACEESGHKGDVFVRTALCLEVRDGHLHLFLPPVGHLEHWIDLLKEVELVSSSLKMPLVLEGYEAPKDSRLKRFSVTPDPGVIEVNIHPANNWKELVEHTECLYEEARQTRLSTEKFMLDGRHSGTGGGNHITLGGASAEDSPMLRRPHVLASLIRYWQNHPALSYLFSGLFIGPTSQAPRVDEARHDALYELDIALKQLPTGDSPSPWLVDRLLRHLLVDLTGNTHRAEFCIDKLYSPDSSSGRLGLVEFRGFEMPPHAHMSLAQGLLLRTLVARFWNHPYDEPMIRWGTELHDRFMLPHYVARDALDVVADLNRWGYAFDPEWLKPFVEFRFPRYGSMNIGDIELELRFAIEPWHVLGEEVSTQGTSRFVDSSVERLQVKLCGMTETQHVVTCNGQLVPLRSTGEKGEYVAGVRYKAWNPPSGLHPNIPVQAPLVFDVIDRRSKQSLGGCTYHVEHPGGRNSEDFPVNAYAAEARRLARFWQHGHSSGEIELPRESAIRHPEQPYTLDLRFNLK